MSIFWIVGASLFIGACIGWTVADVTTLLRREAIAKIANPEAGVWSPNETDEIEYADHPNPPWKVNR